MFMIALCLEQPVQVKIEAKLISRKKSFSIH